MRLVEFLLFFLLSYLLAYFSFRFLVWYVSPSLFGTVPLPAVGELDVQEKKIECLL